MRCYIPSLPAVALALLSGVTITPRDAGGAGPFYANPGWAHVLDGASAFYNDPDGPNPDYVNGNSTNLPGGQQGTAALIHPGLTPGGQVDNANALWIHRGSQWEGTAPGAPLGGPPTGVPPIPPAAPGGVGAFTEADVTFLRLQDAGDPQQWGWADKGTQASATAPRQEGSNRRIQFAHPLSRVPGNSGNAAVLDAGITLSFRARIATPATGPLDKVYEETGPGGGPPADWPELGVGYPVANNGRGMFMVTQNGASGPGQLAFSLLNSEAIANSSISTTRTGLVLNNRAISAAGGSPDTESSTPSTLNIVDLTDTELTQWQEFWVTAAKLMEPVAGNTHEVKVWSNGSLAPRVFQVVLGTQNEFGSGAHLGLGLSSGTRWGAFDVDYFAYREGVLDPLLADPVLEGDYNFDDIVDAADYAVWRDGLGTEYQEADYLVWVNNFGESSGAPPALPAPEPAAAIVLAMAACCCCLLRRVQNRDGLCRSQHRRCLAS